MSKKMTNKELTDLMSSLVIAQAKNEKAIADLTQSIQKTTEERLAVAAAFDKQIALTREEVYGVGHSQGLVAEDYFYNSLSETLKLGSIKFDRIERNRKVKKPAPLRDAAPLKFECDILLVNGKTLAVIETKYKATKTGLTQLQRNIEGIRLAMPEFDKHTIYGGIAAFSIDDKLIDEAHKKGYFVLQRKGDSFVADTGAMKAF